MLMNRATRAIVALAAAAALFAFASCSSSGGGGTDNGDQKPSSATIALTATDHALYTFESAAEATSWTIALGYQNTSAVPLSVAAAGSASVLDPVNGGTGCMQVDWSSSADFKMCELYAPATAGDYSAYTGITFDVYMPYTENFLVAVRGTTSTGGGTANQTWKDEPYVPKGTGWITVRVPFSNFVDPGWAPGGANADLTVAGFLKNNTVLQVNLNPEMNLDGGNGGALNKDITMYIDNVGFYK
jgi:hypothetical protein